MDSTTTFSWAEADFCVSATADGAQQRLVELATIVYDRVCRTNFLAPGFCLVNLGAELSSQAFRRFMFALERQMKHLHRERLGRDLILMSAARFDQQVTTKPHRDGGPDECFLMLGYEPSSIRADLLMSDYSRCAHDMGLTPREYLEKHNPMFAAGLRILKDYTTQVTCFCNLSFQILLINNSIAEFSEVAPRWQGVLHTATIVNPEESFRRVVNSLMVASVPIGTEEPISSKEQDEFVHTNLVRRSGYDKPNLEDDA